MRVTRVGRAVIHDDHARRIGDFGARAPRKADDRAAGPAVGIVGPVPFEARAVASLADQDLAVRPAPERKQVHRIRCGRHFPVHVVPQTVGREVRPVAAGFPVLRRAVERAAGLGREKDPFRIEPQRRGGQEVAVEPGRQRRDVAAGHVDHRVAGLPFARPRRQDPSPVRRPEHEPRRVAFA